MSEHKKQPGRFKHGCFSNYHNKAHIDIIIVYMTHQSQFLEPVYIFPFFFIFFFSKYKLPYNSNLYAVIVQASFFQMKGPPSYNNI